MKGIFHSDQEITKQKNFNSHTRAFVTQNLVSAFCSVEAGGANAGKSNNPRKLFSYSVRQNNNGN